MTRFAQVLSAEGEEVTWHKREEGSEDPETGDLEVGEVFEPDQTIKAIVQSVRVDEVLIDAGYTVEDYIRIFTISAVQHKDTITWNGNDYEVLPPETIKFRGITEYITAICRRLITNG